MNTLDAIPAIGLMDARSHPSAIPMGGYRRVLNARASQDQRLCRVTGWQKLLDRPLYNNQDLHDQLLSMVEGAVREPVTFLFEAKTTRKSSKLFAGTGTRLYALNIASGNWRLIADRYGIATSRWAAATMYDTVLFTNNKDALVYHVIDQGAEPDGQSVAIIPDFTKLAVSRAAVVVSWQDVMFVMNIVQDGQVFSNRILWSDYQRPISFIESDASVAGNFDLDSGETILAAAPLGSNVLLIYTDVGIWECTLVGGDQKFAFSKRYNPANNPISCLAFKNTLISTGARHLYMGHDGIYSYDLYHIDPTLVDYVHKGSGIVYSNVSRECDVHVAGYNPYTKEAFFSWAKQGEARPTSTFVANTDQAFTYELNHGFNAFCTFSANDAVISIQDYVLEHCICTQEDLLSDPKEGGYCTAPTAVDCPPTVPHSFYSSTNRTLEDGYVQEDYTLTETDADSFCALYGTLTVGQLCADLYNADECKANQAFVGASAVDYALKQFADVYYRERATSFGVCGTWVLDGYRTKLTSGAISFGVTKHDKTVKRFEAEIYPEVQTTPSQVTLRFGTSGQPLDPVTAAAKCAIMWEQTDPKDLECLSELTEAQHIANGTRPDVGYEWPLFSVGRYCYFELEIVNGTKDTGGACCIQRYSVDIEQEERSYGNG